MADFKVQVEGEDVPAQFEQEAEVAPAKFTPLLDLKKRRQEIKDQLFIDLAVPRWSEPTLVARYGPVDTAKLNEIIERGRSQGGKDWSIRANAGILAECCIGVYAVHPDFPDKKFSLREGDEEGTWTVFDHDLAYALGISANSQTETVLGVYYTDGDIIATVNRLLKWSNVSNDEAEENF